MGHAIALSLSAMIVVESLYIGVTVAKLRWDRGRTVASVLGAATAIGIATLVTVGTAAIFELFSDSLPNTRYLYPSALSR